MERNGQRSKGISQVYSASRLISDKMASLAMSLLASTSRGRGGILSTLFDVTAYEQANDTVIPFNLFPQELQTWFGGQATTWKVGVSMALQGLQHMRSKSLATNVANGLPKQRSRGKSCKNCGERPRLISKDQSETDKTQSESEKFDGRYTTS